MLFSAWLFLFESGKWIWHPVSSITFLILLPPLPITWECSVCETSIFKVTRLLWKSRSHSLIWSQQNPSIWVFKSNVMSRTSKLYFQSIFTIIELLLKDDVFYRNQLDVIWSCFLSSEEINSGDKYPRDASSKTINAFKIPWNFHQLWPKCPLQFILIFFILCSFNWNHAPLFDLKGIHYEDCKSKPWDQVTVFSSLNSFGVFLVHEFLEHTNTAYSYS